MSPLRKAESLSVNYSIGPSKPQLLKLTRKKTHGVALVELEHKGDILEWH